MAKATCNGCGKPIVWATVRAIDGSLSGTKIPLDPRPPTYAADLPESTTVDGLLIVERSTARVSHFATCPKANDFSASTKARAEAGG